MAQLSDDRTAFGGDLTRYDQAWEILGQSVVPIGRWEEVRIEDAHGRVLAANILSDDDVPPRDNAAVDGYAFGFDSLDEGSRGPMKVVANIPAGKHWPGTLDPGQAARIFTGAPIPKGADTVVMLEDCRIEGSTIVPLPGIRRGDNRRRAGEDIRRGDTILRRGRRLRAQDVGLAASIGRETCSVWQRPRVVVFSCGDELRAQATREADIRDSNRYVLTMLARELGARIEDGGILPDKPKVIATQLIRASRTCDLVVTSGGMSTGEGDHIRDVVDGLGAIDFWRLAIRPGRPLAIGRIGSTPFAGLPGNPVAAMVTFLIFVRPLMDALLARPKRRPFAYPLPAVFEYRKKPGRREWLRGILCRDEGGHPAVDRFAKSGAGILTSLTAADGLIELAEDVTRVRPGERVDFLPFRELLW